MATSSDGYFCGGADILGPWGPPFFFETGTAAMMSLSGNLDFGEVQTGATPTKTLTIGNPGDLELTVSSFSFPTGFSGDWASGIVPAGGSQAVTVTFSPTSATTFGGTITVNGNQVSGANTITASGTGTPSRFIALTGTLAFGDVVKGTMTSHVLTISNTGTLPLTVSSVTYPAGFSGNWPGGSIAAGSSQPVLVTFAPTSVADYGGAVVVNADQTGGTNTVAASGAGVVVTGDFNADGKSDLLWRNTGTGENVVWLMNGTEVGVAAFGPTIPDVNWEVRGAGDFDGNAKADVIWRNKVTGQNVAWLMDGTTVAYSAFLPTIADTNWEIVGVGDLNGDAKADVILRNKANGQNIVWLMNGASVAFAAFLPTIADTNWEIGGVGDFDFDRKADVIWRNKVTGGNIVWLMDGVAVVSATFLTSANADWDLVGVGDLDGDHKADLVWRNHVTGVNITWLMNGADVGLSKYIEGQILYDTNWEIKAVGDVNGDGKADLIWRNKVTGDNQIWLMTGYTVASRVYLPTISDTSWTIARR